MPGMSDLYTYSLVQNKVNQFAKIISTDEKALCNAIIFCCQNDFKEAMIFLMGIVNDKNQNILHILAGIQGSHDLIKKILNIVNAVNPFLLEKFVLACDNAGNTALEIACENCNVGAVDILSPVCFAILKHQGKEKSLYPLKA
jgi:hypothetical protein